MEKGDNSSNKSVDHHETSHTETVQYLNEQIKKLDFEGMELAQQNYALKVAMSGRETKWKKEKQTMQGQINSAREDQPYEPDTAMQKELEDQLRELTLELRDKDMYIKQLNARPRNVKFATERVKQELSDKCQQIQRMELSSDKRMKDLISQKDAVITKVTSENMALGQQSLELDTQLRAVQREALNNREWETKCSALEDKVKAEQEEKEACFEKIKNLEDLIRDTEEKWSAERQDSLDQERKMEDNVAPVSTEEKRAAKQEHPETGSRRKGKKNGNKK